MIHLDFHSERSEAATQRTKSARPGFQSPIDLIGQPTIQQPEMFESLASCFRISLQRFAQDDRRTMVHFFS
jgi:hypothetical protein